MERKTIITLGALAATVVFMNDAHAARDFANAASQWQGQLATIAKILSVSGILVGAIIMQFGAAAIGKRFLAGGAFATVCAFGAPAFVTLLQTVFGSV